MPMPTELEMARDVAKLNGWRAVKLRDRILANTTEISFSRGTDRVRAGFTSTDRCNWHTEGGRTLPMGRPRLGGDLSSYLGDLLARLRQDPNPPMAYGTLVVTFDCPEADREAFERAIRTAVELTVDVPACKRSVLVSAPQYDDEGNVIL